MGPALLLLLAIVAAVLLAATNRYAKQQREELETLAPPASLDSVGTWEAEVLAAEQAAAAAPAAPGPPVTARALHAVRDQAVLFQQHVPPRADARSYWGGRPRLAPGMVWPAFTAPDGTERAMSFLVQIACDELPGGARLGVFPDTGVLHVFLDLAWGEHWRWRCLWTPGDSAAWPEAVPPPALPRAYSDRGHWTWPQDDGDWPRLLPRWSFTPVLVEGTPADEPVDPVADPGDDEGRLWPGSIDLATALQGLGAVVDQVTLPRGRPFATFPHDWRSVTITIGHLAHHLDRAVRWPSMGRVDEDAAERLRGQLATWAARSREHAPEEPLTADESNEAWHALLEENAIAGRAMRDAVHDSVEATLTDRQSRAVLPEEAIDLVRSRHALASRNPETGYVHVNTPDRMLAAPTCVQVEGDARAAEWLLLLEVSSLPGIGHEFGEGVLQFWIRPDDLAARRFERVELTGEAY
ncbi:DUF1963 domain-containing protein [Nocardioides zhouii]|nr:DUF1963 domain-containing protein [Nocardioides zhouii]